MENEMKGGPEKSIPRREFLKQTALFGSALLLGGGKFNILPKSSKETSSNVTGRFPEINIGVLPEYTKKILGLTLKSRVNDSGVVEVDSNSDGDFSKVPVIQTEINKINLELAEKRSAYLCNETLGIVFHSFGAPDYLLKTYMPNGTAKEYVENGFGELTSAMFLVGDQKFNPKIDLINSPPSIVQCELPTPCGKLVPSAHVIPVDRDQYLIDYKQHYVSCMNQVCWDFHLPYPSSVLQSFFMKGRNSAPNRSMIGIEITGETFDKEGQFPSEEKISSVLTLATALTKYYKMSPAFNFLGHRELDLAKEDPGRRLTYLMKVLVGLNSLKNNDDDLSNIIFGPFIEKSASVQEGVLKYFDFIKEYFCISSDLREAKDYLEKIEYNKIISSLSSSKKDVQRKKLI